VLRIFHYALNPEGFLLLGASESVGDAADLFSIVDRKLKIHVKRNVSAAAVFDFARSAVPPASDEQRVLRDPKPLVTLQQMVDRKVIERYGPPSVVISDELDVLQFRGRTGPYLEPAPGTATLNILKLARPELLMELRSVIQKAVNENFVVTSPVIHMQAEQGYRSVVLEAFPLQDTGVPERCLLVAFREVLTPAGPESAHPTEEGSPDPRIAELARELSSTKVFLQATIEDLEAANEELKSANEELQSANEELQSTNEELETSKEELQSTNEELATVNEELQNRMSELAQNHDDLQNVLATTANPIILVGMDLRIRRFSQSTEKHMNLIPADVGRSINHLKIYLKEPGLERIVAEVINRVVAVEQEVSSATGHSYTMRIVPYKTGDHAIRGALIELDAKDNIE
jgi:two-component system CheB/CheR fusion protein